MSFRSTRATQEWPALNTFKAAFTGIRALPYCSGTVPLDTTASKLFFQGDQQVGVVDFANISEKQLSSLAEACQPASFGRNREDVIDESYRKAGKMDANNFATLFSPTSSDVLDVVRGMLLQGENSEKDIKVELYKLNVYGPGSFFKPHVDTPRSDTMFGSLVVIFPTVHEGGSLIFRHKGQEHIFDTASAVRTSSSQITPHIAFIAFFSDVEHEVSVVTSGYRVTLTYNLYLVDQPAPASVPLGILPDKDPLKDMESSLSSLLSDPDFLPEGGFFGWSLSHKYPFKSGDTRLKDIEKRLKGSDAIVKRICEDICLPVSLKALYNFEELDSYNESDYALVDKFMDLISRDPVDEHLVPFLEENGAIFTYDFSESYSRWDEWEKRIPIVWIQKGEAVNTFKEAYMAYGNEATLNHVYAEVCLVAEVEPFAERRVDIYQDVHFSKTFVT